MRNSRFGLGIANSYFDGDYADWQTASDVCDTDVTPYGSASAIDLLDMNFKEAILFFTLILHPTLFLKL